MKIEVTCALPHAADHKCEVRKELTVLVTLAEITGTLMLAEITGFVKQVSNVTSSVIPINKTGVR